MEFVNPCRICLRCDGGIYKIALCLQPKVNEILPSTVQLYQTLRKATVTDSIGRYDKICRQCLDTIHNMYALLAKCNSTTNTLSRMKGATVKLRKLSDFFLTEKQTQHSVSSVRDKQLVTSSPNMAVDHSIEPQSVARNNEEVVASRDNPSDPVASKQLLATPPSAVDNDFVEIISDDNAAAWEVIAEIDSTNNQTKCFLCKQWNHRHQLELHLHLHIAYSSKLFRVENPQLICPECFFVSKDSIEHHLHVSTHDRKEDDELSWFLCEICGENYRKSQSFFKHLTMHDRREKHQCLVCMERGFHRSEMTSHIIQHIEKYFLKKQGYQYRCRFCGIEHSTRISLRYHLLKKHGYQDHIVCEICKEELRSEVELSTHYDDFAEKHVCGICDQKFNSVEEFESHKLSHRGSQNYCCCRCKMSFGGPQDLNDHLQLHAICPFQCENEHCGRLFSSRSLFFHHVHNHTISANVFRIEDFNGQKQKGLQNISSTRTLNSSRKRKVKKLFRPLRYYPRPSATYSRLAVENTAKDQILPPANSFQVSFLEDQKRNLSLSSMDANHDKNEAKSRRQKKDYSRRTTTKTAPPSSSVEIYESDEETSISNPATNLDDSKPEELETIDLEVKDTVPDPVGTTIDVKFNIFENNGFN